MLLPRLLGVSWGLLRRLPLLLGRLLRCARLGWLPMLLVRIRRLRGRLPVLRGRRCRRIMLRGR